MIVKLKVEVMLDIPGEDIDDVEIEDLDPKNLIQNCITSANMEMVDQDDNDFLEFGNRDITEAIINFTRDEA